MSNEVLAFIGGGNMAAAIIGGLSMKRSVVATSVNGGSHESPSARADDSA